MKAKTIAGIFLSLFLFCLSFGAAQACGYQAVHSEGVIQLRGTEKFFLSDQNELVRLVAERSFHQAICVKNLDALQNGDRVRLGPSTYVFVTASQPVVAEVDSAWFLARRAGL